MIIGLNGLKQSGKDTIGRYLESEYGLKLASFAALLKKSAAALFNVDASLWEELKENPRARVMLYREYDSEGVPGARVVYADLSVREFLQRYGTEAHRDVFGDNFWVDALFKQLNETDDIVITDARFTNELGAINARGGYIVQVDRGGESGEHRSEEVPDSKWIDFTVENFGSMEDLHRSIETLVYRLGVIRSA